jgi:hypothetical protein
MKWTTSKLLRRLECKITNHHYITFNERRFLATGGVLYRRTYVCGHCEHEFSSEWKEIAK